jgi:hypothetical protein
MSRLRSGRTVGRLADAYTTDAGVHEHGEQRLAAADRRASPSCSATSCRPGPAPSRRRRFERRPRTGDALVAEEHLEGRINPGRVLDYETDVEGIGRRLCRDGRPPRDQVARADPDGVTVTDPRSG